MYRCVCGRVFESVAGYAGHCSHCSIYLGHPPVDRFGDSRAWSRNKTKETDERIARAAEKQKRLIAEGSIPKSFLGKHHTEATKAKMSDAARKSAKEHRNGWKGGNSKIQNRYERFTESFLKAHSIPYESEVNIAQSTLGKSGSYYQLDFLVLGRVDLEIDGTSHLTDKQSEHDEVRDRYVSNLYQVYRIQHHDNLEILKERLLIFLDFLKGI